MTVKKFGGDLEVGDKVVFGKGVWHVRSVSKRGDIWKVTYTQPGVSQTETYNDPNNRYMFVDKIIG